MGKIIILNGASSSGKTTLAQKLQQVLPEPYLHIALDQYRDALPAKYRGLNAPADTTGSEGINVVPSLSEQGKPRSPVEFGSYFDRVLASMRRSVAMMSEDGLNVVVDDLLLKPEYLAHYAQLLAKKNAWLIKLHCADAVLEARESARVGRFPGTAVTQQKQVHEHVPTYDLTLDTDQLDPRQAAELVAQRLCEPPTALANVGR